MPPRIPDTVREAILRDIRAGQHSCRAIATKHRVSRTTVSALAKTEGVVDAFGRQQTQNATAARVVDNKARRARIAADLLVDAQRLRERAWTPHPVVVNTSDGPEVVTLPLPPPRDAQAIYTAVGIAVQRSMELDKYDADQGVDADRSMLVDLRDALRTARDSTQARP